MRKFIGILRRSMTNQEQLAQILKKKGIGPESSKSLLAEDIDQLKTLFLTDDTSLTTKATVLTALLTLAPTAIEADFVAEIRSNPTDFLPQELLPFITGDTNSYQSTINEVIKHENLTFDAAETGAHHLFDKSPEYLKGAFLEAERLKRETYEENSAFFQVLKSHVPSQKANIKTLIDLGDSYDGCNRTPSLNLFLACLLAAAGHPTIVHSVDEVAPKEGVTHHQILKAAGKNPLKQTSEAIADLESEKIGWTHLDQQIYHPQLYGLKKVRKEMVKRPFLATFEKMLQPIVAEQNYVVSQYTHKHYKLEVARLLHDFCSFDKAIHVKGIEGTCMINPKIPAECVLIAEDMKEITIYGAELGFPDSLGRYDNITPELCLSIGLEILHDKDLPEKNFLIFQGATLLHYLKEISFESAKKLLETTLSSKKALQHWENLK